MSKLERRINDLFVLNTSKRTNTHANSAIKSYSKNRDLTIEHSEFIRDIVSTTSFDTNTNAINPGNPALFPYLHEIARNYTIYDPHSIVFEYRPTSGEALSSTNTALGSVFMAIDSNVIEEHYSSKLEYLNSGNAVSCRPSQPMSISATNGFRQDYYVRNGASTHEMKTSSTTMVSTSSGIFDSRLNDLGRLQVATQGFQAGGSNVGELYVHYKISFRRIIADGNLENNLPWAHYSFASPTTSNYFGGTRAVVGRSNLDCTIGTSSILFPSGITQGNFAINYQAIGASTALVVPNVTYYNCTAIFNQYAAPGSNYWGPATSTSTVLYNTWPIRITGDDAKVSFASGTLPASSTFGDLYIQQVSGTIDNLGV